MSKRMKKPKPVTVKKKIDILGWTGSIAVIAILVWLTWTNLANFIIKFKGGSVVATVVALPGNCGTSRGSYPEMGVETGGKLYLANLTHDECSDRKFSIGDTLQVITHQSFKRAMRVEINYPETGLLVSLGLVIGWFFIFRARRR